MPTPADWEQNSAATGYWFLVSETEWRPPEALARFLDAGDPPVYVGFGSMGAQSDRDIVSLASEALHSAGRRGVIARLSLGKAPV